MNGLSALFFLFLLQFKFSTAANSTDAGEILQLLEENIPQCALSCTIDSVAKSTCALTDIACICTNQDLNNAEALCLAHNCTVIEQLQTKKYVSTTCGAQVRNISETLTFATWPLYAIAALCVALRMIGKLPRLGGQASWDDYLMVFCFSILTALAAMVTQLQAHGIGQDIWMLSPQGIDDTLFFFWICEFFYCLLVAVTKISVILLYLRIFPSQAFRYQCWTLIAICIMFACSSIISTGLLCNPIDSVWKSWDGAHPGKCVNINALTFAVAGINMALDIAVMVVPIYQLWRLQISTRKKLAVGSMFTVGIFVTICSGIRLGTIVSFQRTTNPTYDYTRLVAWSIIESSASIICACMPGVAQTARRAWTTVHPSTPKTATCDRTATLESAKKYGRVESPRRIHTKTTVSISYADRSFALDNTSERSDELELTPRTGYRLHECSTRLSNDSGRENPKHGYER